MELSFAEAAAVNFDQLMVDGQPTHVRAESLIRLTSIQACAAAITEAEKQFDNQEVCERAGWSLPPRPAKAPATGPALPPAPSQPPVLLPAPHDWRSLDRGAP
jgi:hypothetical protein